MTDLKILRKYRRNQEIKLKDVAEKSGTAASNVLYVEQGKREGVTFRTVEKIANAIGLEIQFVPVQGTTITNKEEVVDFFNKK